MQGAQRQAFTGRWACRLDWQTGHPWSYAIDGGVLGLGCCFGWGLWPARLWQCQWAPVASG
jgi:hypothetical protein